MQILGRLRTWWSERQAARAIVSRSVSCDAVRILQVDRFGDQEEQVRVRWDEVSAVFAYKRDCFAIDKIYIALADAADKIRVEISEDDTGYESLISELPKYLPGCLAHNDWFLRVAVPAFKTNWTELYRRASG
jgi:hypothetical protein